MVFASNYMNKDKLQVEFADGNKIEIQFSESEVRVISSKTGKQIYSFDSSDVKGLLYLSNNEIRGYFSDLISTDSTTEDLLDTFESIKDNVKELYRVNPKLINYSNPNADSRNESPEIRAVEAANEPVWKRTWFIVVVILLSIYLIAFRHDIRCSLQGGEVRSYKPTYQVVNTGDTFEGTSLEYACVKQTRAGYQTLFDIP